MSSAQPKGKAPREGGMYGCSQNWVCTISFPVLQVRPAGASPKSGLSFNRWSMLPRAPASLNSAAIGLVT